MATLVIGILVLLSLGGCDQSSSPVVGTWSHTLLGTVTYTFNPDSSCSLTAPDVATGQSVTVNGTYALTYIDSHPQLTVMWEHATNSAALAAAQGTLLSWNQSTGGLCISLYKQ